MRDLPAWQSASNSREVDAIYKMVSRCCCVNLRPAAKWLTARLVQEVQLVLHTVDLELKPRVLHRWNSCRGTSIDSRVSPYQWLQTKGELLPG